jgi:uncharacterized protein (DUF1330 family)
LPIASLLADQHPVRDAQPASLRREGGRETYREYAEKAQPFLEGVGGELLYAGDCSTALVAPEGHHWDTILLVRYPSPAQFLNMVSNQEYLKVTEIRTRALAGAVLQVTAPWPDV